jgi:endonuclease-3
LKVRDTELQEDIRTTGFFRNKTKSIQGACAMLVDEFESEVPRTMDELLKLPGVARKTANVVLGVAYGIAAGIVVDTHVSRLSHRLGLTKQKDAVKIEQDFIGIGAQERLDHLLAPPDLSRPANLQSAAASV